MTEGAIEMLVKTYYSTGHFDVFDTVNLVDAPLYKKNALTNFALEISDARVGRALWLDVFYYEADDSYREDLNPRGLPVARRRDGWSFVLADEHDLATLLKVSVDGEDVLIRQGDEFVDALQLRLASEVAYGINPETVSTHDYWQVAMQDGDACGRIGYSESAYEGVLKAQARTATPAEDRNSSKGATDEDRFSLL